MVHLIESTKQIVFLNKCSVDVDINPRNPQIQTKQIVPQITCNKVKWKEINQFWQ